MQIFLWSGIIFMESFSPIGLLSAQEKYKYEQPRQGHYASNRGSIRLNGGMNYEQALEDLSQFDKIWLIYLFDQNSGWRPKVSPPINVGRKIGLFATRSPYRPNPIGISVVDLVSIKGRVLEIANFDLLDGTPILDIKPYIAEHDSFPEASRGWLPNVPVKQFEIGWSSRALSMASWIVDKGEIDIVKLVSTQLSIEPINSKKKRVASLGDGVYILSVRTWRIEFKFDGVEVEIRNLYSGYSHNDLLSTTDKYGDKEVHREFRIMFSTKG